jgi:hypothetical protein
MLATASAFSAPTFGTVQRGVRTLLRLEDLVCLLIAVALYRQAAGSWALFAGLFLVPDVAMLGYLAGPRVGAAAYNAAHSFVGALLLTVLGFTMLPAVKLVALIWVAHIAFDRAVGYGLKYADSFGHTHIGMVGRPTSAR